MARRNRSFEYLLFLIPLFIIAFSVGYTVKRWKNSSQHASDPGELASQQTYQGFDSGIERLDEGRKKKEKPVQVAEHAKPSVKKSEAKPEVEPEAKEDQRKVAVVTEQVRTPAARQSGEVFTRESGIELSAKECESIEIPGKGPKLTSISSNEWSEVMNLYHDVKVELVSWLEKNQEQFGSELYMTMKKQVEELRIQRAPAAEEPDLSYRGIVVLSRYPDGRPLVRIGGGFVDLMKRDLSRSRFEMTRVVAQSWSPCELKKQNVNHPWAPLAQCMDVKAESCEVGTYSEAGWAISSAVASAVYSPGCTIPAFQDSELARCVLQMPLQRSIASHSVGMTEN